MWLGDVVLSPSSIRGGGVFINTDYPYGPRGHHGGSGRGTRGQWLALAGFVGLPLLVGVTAGVLTVPAVQGWYQSLNRPPGTPPAWLFAPVWAVLYLLIGVAAWLVWRARQGSRDFRPLRLWGWQLLVNAAWSPAFFGLHSLALGLVVIVALLLLIVATLRSFRRVRPAAAVLMLPYLAWVCYAAYLNAGFVMLNP